MKIDVPQDVLDDLKERLSRIRWPNQIPDSGWDYGTNLDYMQELVDYWLTKYDWRKEEARLNQYPHYKADVDGLGIHFIHEKGKGPNPMPLILLHGYPWSITTLYRIIPMLTDPASYGGKPEDAFTVIVPSLIGFGFSDPPMERGFGFQHHPERYRKLLREGLGYERYGVQGGDWGGIITYPWGHQYPEDIIGIYINYMGIRMRDEVPEDEKDPNLIRGVGLQNAPIRPRDPDSLRFWKAAEKYWMYEGGYAHVNMTRPQSFSYAMSDSPVGLAAWLIEKFRSWSDWDDDFEDIFSKDELITNVMMYWVPNTFCSAIRIYYESHHNPWKIKPGERIEVPTGICAFPKCIVPIIKSRAEQYYNVVRFKEMARGGHFGIWEKADTMASEMREFFRPLRNNKG